MSYYARLLDPFFSWLKLAVLHYLYRFSDGSKVQMDDNLAEELEDILDKRDPGMTGQPLYDRLAEPRLLLGRHRRQVSLFMDFGSGRRRTEFKTKCCGAEALLLFLGVDKYRIHQKEQTWWNFFVIRELLRKVCNVLKNLNNKELE